MNNSKNYQPSTAWLFAAAVLLACAASALAATHYVDVNSTNATPPYTNWAAAATNIQDAVDAAVAGDEIVVTNGIYASGGRPYNRVEVDKPVEIRSANGPQFTFIEGDYGRCVYLTNGASLSGFTLTNGNSWDDYGGGVGGGVAGLSTNAVVTNCLITGNRVSGTSQYAEYGLAGGGAYSVTLDNCTLTGNSAVGIQFLRPPGFPSFPIQAWGGGAAYCTLNSCVLSGNSVVVTNEPQNYMTSYSEGGGAAFCTLNNCVLCENLVLANCLDSGGSAHAEGGGAYDCTLNNCTLAGNAALAYGIFYPWGAFAIQAAAYNCLLNNCIRFANDVQWVQYYCEDCPSPGVLEGNNWRGDPLFLDTNGWANLRLQSNSPCINAGNNAYVVGSTDLDSSPRIAGGTVDMGAYEFQTPVSKISYAWLQYYGLPINAATDTADPDGDGVDNYHEWLAGTNPTNPLSSPAQLTITPAGVSPSAIVLTWSTNAVGFALQSATDLASAALWTTNLPAPVVIGGQNVVTNPISGAQQFYRLVH
jgi:hypothetical protein